MSYKLCVVTTVIVETLDEIQEVLKSSDSGNVIARDVVNTGIFVSHQNETSVTTMEIAEIIMKSEVHGDKSSGKK